MRRVFIIISQLSEKFDVMLRYILPMEGRVIVLVIHGNVRYDSIRDEIFQALDSIDGLGRVKIEEIQFIVIVLHHFMFADVDDVRNHFE